MHSYEKIVQDFLRKHKMNNRIKVLRVCMALCIFCMTYLLLTQDAITMEKQEDFSDDITSFTISVNDNGSWKESTSFKDGDQIKVAISYKIIPGENEDVNVIYYQLPEVITPNVVDSGVVWKDGKDVGVYTISTDGLIVITFNDNLDTTKEYTGDISFTGYIEASDDHEDDDIIFNEEDNTFKYKEDISAEKNVSAGENDTYNYTVTINSKNGTDEETIDVTDKFVTGDGYCDANYVEGSFTITKNSADGSNEIEHDVAIDNTSSPSIFSINDLPALGEGESYTITYSATPDVSAEDLAGTDAINLKNYVLATSGEISDDDDSDIKIKEEVIPVTYDLSTAKKVSTTEEDGVYDYTVTISSVNGTGEAIDVTDVFMTSDNGGQDADYVANSFVITKELADGTTQTIDISAVIDNSTTPSTFKIENLPALDAGESYSITYKAKTDISDETYAGTDAINLKNHVRAESGDLTKDSYANINVRDEIVYDLSADKSIGETLVDGSYSYKIIVSSDSGTDDNPVDISDSFVVTTNGGQDADYNDGTFTITKISEEGETETVTHTVEIDNTTSPASFEILGLPALAAGESYEVEYTATPTIDTSNTTDTGAMTLSNKVAVESGDLKDEGIVNSQLSADVVKKEGSYNSSTQIATWTVYIYPGVQDLSGFTLEDTVTVSDGTKIVVEEATMKATDGTTTTISLPYTFPSNFDNSQDYVITYTADLSVVSANQNIQVSNIAALYKDEIRFEDDDDLPNIYNDTYDVEKDFASSDESTNRYKWLITIPFPAREQDVSGDLVYTDTITTNLSDEVRDAHYTTVGELRGMVIYAGEEVVSEDDYTISFTVTNFPNYVHYDNKTITNELVPDTQMVSAFVVTFKEDVVKEYVGSDITMEYYTYIDTKDTAVNGIYTIKNTGKVGNHTDTAETTYSRVEGIDKKSKTVSGSYTDNAQTLDYEVVYDESLGGAVMTYRAYIVTDVYTLDQLKTLTLTDTLPEGATLLENEENSVAFYFGTPYNNDDVKDNLNDYNAFPETYGNAYAKDYLSYNVTGTSSVSEVVTFFFTSAFFNDYAKLAAVNLSYVTPLTFVIEYKVLLPDPSEWGGEASQTFANSLSYGSEIVVNEVTLESDQQFISKIGEQENITTSYGDMYTDNVNYSMIVNQDEQNLNLNGDTVLLTDTMEFDGANGAVANIVPNSLQVYEYDPEQEDGRGDALTTSEYAYTTTLEESADSTKYIFDLTIPDERALLIEYTYYVNTSDDNTVGNFDVINSVTLQGSSEYKDDNKLEFIKNTDQATVAQQSLTLFKYEEGNEAVSLAGATFYFEKYKDADGNGTYEWVETAFGENSRLSTDEDGMISFNLFGEDNQIHYEVGVLYRFTEVAAPEGYMLDDTPRYFVFVDDAYNDDTLSYAADYVEIPEGVYIKDIIFIVNDQTILPISNVKNVVEVEKNWVDEDLERISATQDTITIDLYRQESILVDSHDITVTSTAVGTTSSDGFTEKDITKTLSVCEGSDLVIAAFNSAGITQQFKVNGTTTNGFVDPLYPNIVYYRIYDITEDMDITIQAENAQGQTYDFYFFEFEQAAYEPTGDKVKVGTYTITKDDNWSIEWKLNNSMTEYEGYLPYSSEDGNPYYYSVVESSVPSGFTVTYSDTNFIGINNGTITVTNIKNPYALPTTGSTGGIPIRILAVVIFVAASTIYLKKNYKNDYKKRKVE